MIYKFRIVSDEVDNFKREICIDSDASFLELHDAILDSVGFSKDQMTSFFICDDDWEKKTEITLMDMGKDSDEDTWIMASTKLSDLIEDEGQRLVFVFDYMTDRMFFMELKEIEPGKDLETPVCTRKEGNPPQQTMDFEELEKMDLSRVKIMWTNYPNMPTGANATMELYEKLVDFARRHQIVIVNDNPYSFILNRKPISILNVPGAKECCIEFNSMSKSHNMPGWRVGMLATNATFVQWILKIKSNIDSGTFRPLQLAAAQAYHNSAEWHEEANIQTYARRRKLAEEIMHTLGCTFDPEQVGMFLWGRIPDHYADVEELTEKVLHEARVFITPGFIFGSNGKRYIRISLCAKEPQLEEALKRIQAIMNK